MKVIGSNFAFILFLSFFCIYECCLITNCPRGGKRNGRNRPQTAIKQCISCGPGWTGQCFGPNICCGPFGCLLGTPETIKCQQEGQFNEPEPCIAGISNCRKNSGRCATEGICCNQDSCHVDPSCIFEEKPTNTRLMVDSLYTLYHAPGQMEQYGNDITAA